MFSDELLPLLPAERSGRALDIGCGFGYAMRALQNLGFDNVEGVETSAEQATRAHRSGLRVSVVDDTTSWLRNREGSFSVVLLLDVLEHVPVAEQIDLLRAIVKSLVPGGKVIIKVPNASAILATRWRYNDFTHHSSFTEVSLQFALANAGFRDIRIFVEKGLGAFPKRLWRRAARQALRRYLVRWCWLQVYKAELSWENLNEISFDLNLKAVACRHD
jgi:SAM-dependent methyltransferase